MPNAPRFFPAFDKYLGTWWSSMKRIACHGRHRHARRHAMPWANYCATAPITSCCSRLRRTKAIRKTLRCSSSCSIPMPMPMFAQSGKRWIDKGRPSTFAAPRRRWSISRNANRTDSGSPVRCSRSVFRTPPTSRSMARNSMSFSCVGIRSWSCLSLRHSLASAAKASGQQPSA